MSHGFWVIGSQILLAALCQASVFPTLPLFLRLCSSHALTAAGSVIAQPRIKWAQLPGCAGILSGHEPGAWTLLAFCPLPHLSHSLCCDSPYILMRSFHSFHISGRGVKIREKSQSSTCKLWIQPSLALWTWTSCLPSWETHVSLGPRTCSFICEIHVAHSDLCLSMSWDSHEGWIR